MSYALSPEVERRINEQMALGHYNSADDLLIDALAALAERRDDIAAIEDGIADMDAGRMRPLEEVDAAIRAKHGFPPDE
jgi:antitoxin ParD1/3/4